MLRPVRLEFVGHNPEESRFVIDVAILTQQRELRGYIDGAASNEAKFAL
jgi:hypothetical protein